MTQEEKQLLLKDLCARLPYGVILDNPDSYGNGWDELISVDVSAETVMLLYNGRIYNIEDVKPYLRPMESMTEEEEDELNSHITGIQSGVDAANLMIWIYQHHLDVFHLIEKLLALEAPEGMYKNK